MGTTDIDRMLQVVGGLDRFLVGVRDPALRHVALSREQWQVLCLLADGQGHPMGEIAEGIGLTGATATRVVDSLVQNAQAYRRSDPFDRRRTLIHLAEPGQDLLATVDDVMADRVESLLADLDPGERGALVRLLGRLRPGAAVADGRLESDPVRPAR